MDGFTPDGTGESATPRQTPPAPRTSLDTVVQRLFAVGLTVQSVAASLPDDERGARLRNAVANIDITIREVRTHMGQTTTGDRVDTTAPVGDGRP